MLECCEICRLEQRTTYLFTSIDRLNQNIDRINGNLRLGGSVLLAIGGFISVLLEVSIFLAESRAPCMERRMEENRLEAKKDAKKMMKRWIRISSSPLIFLAAVAVSAYMTIHK